MSEPSVGKAAPTAETPPQEEQGEGGADQNATPPPAMPEEPEQDVPAAPDVSAVPEPVAPPPPPAEDALSIETGSGGKPSFSAVPSKSPEAAPQFDAPAIDLSPSEGKKYEVKHTNVALKPEVEEAIESGELDMTDPAPAAPVSAAPVEQAPPPAAEEPKPAATTQGTKPQTDDFMQDDPRAVDSNESKVERYAQQEAAAVAAAAPPPPAEGQAPAGDPPKDEKPKLRLGEQLIQSGLISPDQLDVALQEQRQNKGMLGQILVDMGFITDSALGEILAESSGTEKFGSDTMLDPTLISKIPKDVCMRNKVIPIAYEDDETVKLAMTDVYNVLAIDQVRRHLPKHYKIMPVFSTETEILQLIDQYYEYEMSISGILREIETGIRENNRLDGSEDGYVNPTVRLVNALLIDAIRSGASDIHFEPEGQFLRLRNRIDGALQQVRTFHRDYWSAMVVRIKIMSGMNIAETRQPQDGRIVFRALGRDIDFRVATQPTVHGENIVLRILDKSKALMPLEKLGFSDHNDTVLKRCLKRPEGIIIVTGPTGSGKTTTLYSTLSYINSIDVNIMTLEDPVEYQLPLIRQTHIREGTMDFASGIKSLMRQDPDIVFIGEVRDEETAIMAVRAALTGHQVFTTLHTNDALGAIPRLGDIGVPAHLLAGSLICSIAQRLARRLCDKCKKPVAADEETCNILGADPTNPPTIHEAVGCDACKNKGYKGRVAVVEILRIDEGLDELISTHATRNQMMDHALQNGFVPMVQDGINKVLEGLIDVKELVNTVDLTARL